MQIARRPIDDFKTDRKDITPPLPILFRLIPLLFYCAIALALILNTVFIIQLRVTAQKRDDHIARQGILRNEITAAEKERTQLESRILVATNIEEWVQGSRSIQPLVVAVARSINEKSSILDLRLDRDEKSPGQIHLTFRLATDSIRQLDDSLAKIAELNYRAISPQQNMGRGEVDYKATLIRQDPQRDAAVTIPAASGTAARTTP